MAHGFDHLDGANRVKRGVADVAVVLQAKLRLGTQALIGQSLLRMRELLLAERHAGEAHAPFAGDHFGQRAPAAAYFEQALVVPWREVDHAQGTAHFGVLRLVHGQHGVAIEPGR